MRFVSSLAPLEGFSEFLGHDPLIDPTSFEQADEGGFRPVKRHDVLEQDPENYQMERPENVPTRHSSSINYLALQLQGSI